MLFSVMFTILVTIIVLGGVLYFIENPQDLCKIWIPILAICILSIPFYTGIAPNYMHGKAVFVVKGNREGGIIFKSYDVSVCYPSEKDFQSNLFRFSTQNKEIANVLKENLGKKVEIKYRTWYFESAKLSSPNEPLEVTPITLEK